MGKDYYLQVLLEKFKYIVQEKNVCEFTNDELESFPDKSDEKGSDESECT